MIQLITKRDLPDYTKASVNIGDNLINPPIRDAHEFDVLPMLTATEQQALAAYLADADRPAFATAYKAAELLGFPPAELAVLEASPLYARHVLYMNAVRPLLCHNAYRRLLLDHGVHVTDNAVEYTTDTPVSGAQRNEMRADAAAKCSHYQAVFLNALRTYRGPTANPSHCGATRRRPASGGLRSSVV